MFACKKENLDFKPTTQTISKVKYIDKNGDVLLNIYKDNKATSEDESAHVVEGYDSIKNEYTVRYFENLDELYSYSINEPLYSETKKNIEMINAIHDVITANGDILLENPTEENISQETLDVLISYGYKMEGKTNGLAILFDSPNHSGQSLGIVGAPVFNFGSFRNKASSGIGFGLGTFAMTKTWFRGRWVSLLLSGPFNLSLINFNNDLESGF